MPQLLRLALPGALSAWEAAGFARNNDPDDIAFQIGGVAIGVPGGADASWGWRDGPQSREGVDRPPSHWAELGAAGFTEVDVQGIATSIDNMNAAEHTEYVEEREAVAMPHPNGALSLYSVCVTTPDLDSTIAAFEAAGLDLRRVRKPHEPGSSVSKGLQMAFFKFGTPPHRDVILELIAPGGGAGAPLPGGFPLKPDGACIAGLVVRVAALAPVAELLGPELLGRERDAVQGKGMRIATLNHAKCGLPLPLAFMSAPEASS